MPRSTCSGNPLCPDPFRAAVAREHSPDEIVCTCRRILFAGVPVTVEQVCELARTLPRSSEAVVRGRTKFRIGSIVYLAFSKDGTTMGFGFPKEWRQAQVDAEPDKFSLPGESDMRFHWLHVQLDRIDLEEMRDLVEGAWAMCVPKFVAAEYAAAHRAD